MAEQPQIPNPAESVTEPIVRSPFSFVLNPMFLRTSFEIIDGCWLTVASKKERQVISEFLSRFGQLPGGTPFQDYVVIHYKTLKHTEHNADIDLAFALLKLSLQIGFTMWPDATGYSPSWYPGVMSKYSNLFHLFEDGTIQVEEAELNEIKMTCHRLAVVRKSAPEIVNVIKFFADIKTVVPGSPYLVLCYFAIIEGLITTRASQQKTKQIKTKMPKLTPKFERPLDYTVFGKANPQTIWAKLYAYRSDIAHGSIPDFANDLSLLKDNMTALAFLKEAAKLLSLYALANPVEISAVRNTV